MLDKFESPKAKCEYPFVQKPNIDREGKYKDRYKITLIVDKENKEHVEFLKLIAKYFKESKGKNNPVKAHLDEDKNPTGFGAVTFVSNAKFPDGSDKEPIPTYDSKGNREERKDNFIANGSVVKVNWSPYPYKTGEGGLSLILNGVQIIDLIPWEGGDVKFKEEEAYVAEKEEPLFSGNPDPRKKSALEEETSLPKNLW